MIIIPRRKVSIYEWHRWFAWYPVTTNEGDVVWLETVNRKVDDYSEHRRLPKEPVDDPPIQIW